MAAGKRVVRAEDLVESQAHVDGSTRIKSLLQWFKDNPGKDYVAVVDRGVVAGLVGRDELNGSMAGQYGFSLMSERPVREALLRDVVFAEASMGLGGVVRKLVGSNLKGRAFYQDLVIVMGGQFVGLASVKRLLIEEVLHNLEQAEQLRRGLDPRVPEAPAARSDTFSGDLRDFPVMDLAQILSQGGKMGELQIAGECVAGSIFFNGGRIIHASVGGESGGGALHALLKVASGTFSFVQGVAAAHASIDKPAMAALLEAGQAIDEERAAGAA